MGIGALGTWVGFGFQTSTLRSAATEDGSGFEFPRLCGCGGEAEAEHFGHINVAVNVLAGANPDGPVGFRLAKPGNVKLGDITPAVRGGRQQAQKIEVLHVADATPDRGGAIDQGVLRRRALNASRSATAPGSGLRGAACPRERMRLLACSITTRT